MDLSYRYADQVDEAGNVVARYVMIAYDDIATNGWDCCRDVEEGARAGKVPPLAEMLEDYYAHRGWNVDGWPSEETLERLGLEV